MALAQQRCPPPLLTKRRAFKPGAANSRHCRLLPTGPTRVEHEYFREGAWAYLSAWDVHRAKVFGRCEVKNGIAPVQRLVTEVMAQEPYTSARRVFWIMDNCSAHRGQKAVERFRAKWPNTILIHACWLNQIEIYFSIVQRKVLTLHDFSSLSELEQRLLAFQVHYERTASPSSGLSHGATCKNFSPRPNAWLAQPDRVRNTLP